MYKIKNVSVSVDLLKPLCQSYLQHYHGRYPVVFPETPNYVLPQGKKIHVVLFAHALPTLLEAHLWAKNQKYKFWVLSYSHKMLATRLLSVPARRISVIPREKIVPSKKDEKAWPKDNEPFSLIISSNFLPRKNVRLAFELASELQKITAGRAQLLICSPRRQGQASERINPYKYFWIHPFTDLGFLKSDWHRQIKAKNPILLHLSTFYTEDFGMSVAQARELGWPVIISDWAAFKEVSGKSIIRISAQKILQINRARKNSLIRKKLVNDLAQEVLRSMKKNKKIKKLKIQSQAPLWTDRSDIEVLGQNYSEIKIKSFRAQLWSKSIKEEGQFFNILSQDLA